jgi:phospholipid N-methyltransferase
VKQSLYARPDKPRFMAVNSREDAPEMARPQPVEILEVDSRTECHITPEREAAYMVDCLELGGGEPVLEPHSGTGSLIQALLDDGHTAKKITAIELNLSLCGVVRERFTGEQKINPIQSCFLEYAAEKKGKISFPRIILNPPFRGVKKHMKAALSLLHKGDYESAVLVALVPITYTHPEAETCDILENDIFPNAKVNTKIIRIIR